MFADNVAKLFPERDNILSLFRFLKIFWGNVMSRFPSRRKFSNFIWLSNFFSENVSIWLSISSKCTKLVRLLNTFSGKIFDFRKYIRQSRQFVPCKCQLIQFSLPTICLQRDSAFPKVFVA